MNRQIIQRDHVARPQGGAGYLVKAGGEHRAVHGPVYAQQCPEAVRGEGGDEHHVGTAVQGHRLIQAAVRRGAAVAAIGQIHAGSVHENQASDVFLGKGLQE